MGTSLLAGVKVGDGAPVRLMGVINVSPESFYKGSVFTRGRSIAQAARRITAEGADFIDVGAMSTAPYLKTHISMDVEEKRMEWAVRIIRKNSSLPISVDTTRSQVALAGLKAGARIVNDVSGLSADPHMAAVAKRAGGVILMANPQSAKDLILKNPIRDTKYLLKKSLHLADQAGILRSRIVLDPGIGFFRNTKMPWWRWDASILKNLEKLRSLKAPILVGVSRKSFIGHILNGKPAEERLAGSLAATVVAIVNGASIIRTHDVAATKEAVRVATAILEKNN